MYRRLSGMTILSGLPMSTNYLTMSWQWPTLNCLFNDCQVDNGLKITFLSTFADTEMTVHKFCRKKLFVDIGERSAFDRHFVFMTCFTYAMVNVWLFNWNQIEMKWANENAAACILAANIIENVESKDVNKSPKKCRIGRKIGCVDATAKDFMWNSY